jgi:hypothetical protein
VSTQIKILSTFGLTLERALRHLVRAARADSPIARQMVERIGFPLGSSAEAAGKTGR